MNTYPKTKCTRKYTVRNFFLFFRKCGVFFLWYFFLKVPRAFFFLFNIKDIEVLCSLKCNPLHKSHNHFGLMDWRNFDERMLKLSSSDTGHTYEHIHSAGKDSHFHKNSIVSIAYYLYHILWIKFFTLQNCSSNDCIDFLMAIHWIHFNLVFCCSLSLNHSLSLSFFRLLFCFIRILKFILFRKISQNRNKKLNLK